MIKYAAITRKGIKRGKNEDRVMVADNYLADGEIQGETEGSFLAVVCDGVGSETYGDKAAEIASMSFLPLCKNSMSIFDISSAVVSANNAVCSYQKKGECYKCMATTIAGIYLQDETFVCFNLGDSRVYLLTDNDMVQISKDHTQAQNMVNEGKIANSSKAPRSMQDTITKYIGSLGNTSLAALKKGRCEKRTKAFLLCSDGLYKKLTNYEIKKVMVNNDTVAEKSRTLLDFAIKKGSTDDISVIVIELK